MGASDEKDEASVGLAPRLEKRSIFWSSALNYTANDNYWESSMPNRRARCEALDF